MTAEQYVAAFHSGSRDASRDFDDFNLTFVQQAAAKMRREANCATPYADGYCIRVGELTRDALRKITSNA